MSEVVIYALCDPLEGGVRYVGKTKNLRNRVRYGHLGQELGCRRLHKANWLRGIANAGKAPVVRVLDRVSAENWQARERFWIAFFRASGADLTNMTDGGDGGLGRAWTDEQRNAARERCSGKPRPPEVGEKVRQKLKGRAPSQACKDAQRKALFGSKRTPEQVEAVRAAVIGNRFASKHTYMCVSPTGRVFDVGRELSRFCKERGLTASAMRLVAAGNPRYRLHKGWDCKYTPELGAGRAFINFDGGIS